MLPKYDIDTTLRKLSAMVDGLCSNLRLGLQVLNLGSSMNVIEGIQANHEMVRMERADRLMADMQRWLNASDISVQHNDTINKQHSSTGNWFIRGPVFSSWHAKVSTISMYRLQSRA